jgi:P27 family predicted phage terminase small subunit
LSLKVVDGTGNGRIPPDPPDFLTGSARDEWIRLVSVLTGPEYRWDLDVGALTGYCASWAVFRQATERIQELGVLVDGPDRGPLVVKNPAVQIARDAQAKMDMWGRRLGLSPEARKALKIEDPAPVDKADRLLS